MNTSTTASVSAAQLTSPAAPIDWQAVQEKLARMHATTQQVKGLTAEEKLAVLKTRAQTLARTPEETTGAGLQVDITEFRLGDETYAFLSTAVREVYPLKGLTPLPCTPSFVLGVINVRGRILPIVDLTTLFGLAKQYVSEQSTAILLKVNDLEVGIVANLVIGVRSLSFAEIHPPLSTLANSRARYLQGITTEGLIILDAAKLLGGIRLGNHE
jgi:purine-binding chemotaxis protein CheW